MAKKTYKIGIINNRSRAKPDAYSGLIDNTMEKFSLPEGVTEIKSYLFQDNTNLKEVDLTGCTKIGFRSFAYTYLEKLIIPNSIKEIENSALDSANIKRLVINNIKKIPDNFNQYNAYIEKVEIYGEDVELGKNAFAYSRSSTDLNKTSDFYYSGKEITLGSSCFYSSSIKEFYIDTVKKLGGSCFRGSDRLKEVGFNLYSIDTSGSYYFYDCRKLEKVNINIMDNINGLRYYSFYNCYKINELNLNDFDSKMSGSIENYAFYSVGNKRDNLSDTLIIDLHNSKFNSVGEYSFAALKNTIVKLRTTVKTINAYAFQNCSDLQLMFYYDENSTSIPTLSNINAFAGISNLKIFFDTRMINNVLANTNWATYKENIYPMSSGVNSLEQTIGDYDLLWYYDSDFTRLVGENDIINPETAYFAKIGPAYLESVKEFNCSITVQNASDLTVYNESDRIPLGTKLKITITPNSGYMIYSANINDNSVEAPNNVIQTISEGNITVGCLCWDGVNSPIEPVFADNTWEQIAIGLKDGSGIVAGWKAGDTKQFTTTDGKTYTARLVDTRKLYDGADENNNPSSVFEVVELININGKTSFQYVLSGTDYNTLNLNVNVLPQFYDLMPKDLKNVIKNVKVPYYEYYNQKLNTVNSKLFVPNEYELTGQNQTEYVVLPETQYEYYIGKDLYSLKKKEVVSGSTLTGWWLRNIKFLNEYRVIMQSSNMFISQYGISSNLSVSPFFTI